MERQFQIGNLVAHKSNGVIGIIVEEIQSRIGMFDDKNKTDCLFSIVWFDGISHLGTNHWRHELEKVSS